MEYLPTIGLEIHTELKTKTKMFCGSANDSDENKPNSNICPICMGHPGTLPVINMEAVRLVLMVGTALDGRLADYTEFDRKNYFYPDIPKGYQISQYQYPLVASGTLNDIQITRIHLEEDTARSTHDTGSRSLLDYNRAGVPLMELVTEPVIHSAEEAVSFSRDFRVLLRFLGVSEANMEKGQMRIEANVSVSNERGKFGTKVEIKNLNSFKAVEGGIKHEIKRQTELLKLGKKVIQETRGWDEAKEVTFSQRKKEVAHDYRYFPDPDLPKLKLSTLGGYTHAEIKATLPELPNAFISRLKEIGIHDEKIGVFLTNDTLRTFFNAVVANHKLTLEAQNLCASYLTSDVAGLLKSGSVSESNLLARSTDEFFELLTLLLQDDISSRAAKDILPIWLASGGSIREIAQKKGLLQIKDTEELQRLVFEVIEEHAEVADEYKNGKKASLQFLIGQGMKKSKGSANPTVLSELFKVALSK